MSWFHNLKNSFLDTSIAFSYDKSGFARHQQQFISTDLEIDCTGKRYLITGANSGLGKATAMAIADRGGMVHLLCRSSTRAQQAQEEIIANTGNKNIFINRIDMSDLADVSAVAPTLTQEPIEALIHNAGILPNTLTKTPQDHESTFATNILGAQLLTMYLQENLSNNPSSRLIWVSSGGMYPVRLNIQKMQHPPKKFDGVRAYALTKRAQVILSTLWQRKTGIWSQSMHPGWADTKGVQNSLPQFQKMMEKRLRNAEEGADTTVWLAIAKRPREDLESHFWFDRKKAPKHHFPWTKSTPDEQEELWTVLTDILSPYIP